MPAAGELPFLGVTVAEDRILLGLFFFFSESSSDELSRGDYFVTSPAVCPRYQERGGGEGIQLNVNCAVRNQLSRLGISDLYC